MFALHFNLVLLIDRFIMPRDFRVVRRTPRSFAQIALDRSEEESIASDLADARRIARTISPVLKDLPLGVDFSRLGNIRLRDGKIILFVRSSLQKSKLRQVLPRISDLVQRAGYLQSIEIVIRPVDANISLRKNLAQGSRRTLSESSAQNIAKTADALADSPLKNALAALAKTVREKKAP